MLVIRIYLNNIYKLENSHSSNILLSNKSHFPIDSEYAFITNIDYRLFNYNL